jgi:hypothetical protein
MSFLRTVFKKKILLSFKGFFVFFLGVTLSFAGSLDDHAQSGYRSFSGLRLIDLGAYYISDVSKDAEQWAEKDKDSFVVKFATKQADVSKTVVTGFVNVGKTMALIGLAKEYENLLVHNEEEAYKRARLNIVRDRLLKVQEALRERKVDSSWVTQFFEKENILTQHSLGLGVKSFGSIFGNLHVYGVGVELVSDIPLGSLASFAFKNDTIKNIGDSATYQSMKGILYFMRKVKSEESNQFFSTSFAQQGARIQGSVLTRGVGQKAPEFNFTVRLSLIASTEELTKFNEENLNHSAITELNLKNDFSLGLPDRVQGLVKKTVEGLDSSDSLGFLKETLQVALGVIHSTSSKDVVSDNTPNVLFRFSIGDHKQTLMKGLPKTWLEPSVSFGFLTVDKLIK